MSFDNSNDLPPKRRKRNTQDLFGHDHRDRDSLRMPLLAPAKYHPVDLHERVDAALGVPTTFSIPSVVLLHHDLSCAAIRIYAPLFTLCHTMVIYSANLLRLAEQMRTTFLAVESAFSELSRVYLITMSRTLQFPNDVAFRRMPTWL